MFWKKQIGFIDGYGSFGTPSTDGSILIVSSGFKSDPSTAKGSPGGGLIAVDGNGKTRWTLLAPTTIYGYVAICNGIGFAGMDSDFTALDISNGAVLWKYRAQGLLYSSAAIVRSGIYTADMAGNVYAFALPGTRSNRR
jgi:outer membrane protein assembly factor BamB